MSRLSMRAMILAAGRGERMRPLTDTCPKPLLTAGGKSLIEWHLERLGAAGITDVVINHAHLGSLIEDALGNGSRFGVRIRYSAEEQALETAGGIRKALPLLGSAPFLVISGDIYCDVDIAGFVADARPRLVAGDHAYLLLVNNPSHHPDGDFVLAGGRIREAGHERYTFSGIGIYTPALFAALPGACAIRLAPVLRRAIAAGRVSGRLHPGYWLDVGTPRRLAELDAHLRQTGCGR